MNSVEQLMSGSAKLNQMHADIQVVVRTITGVLGRFYRERVPVGPIPDATYTGDTATWQIRWGEYTFIDCFEGGSSGEQIFTSLDKEIPARHVERLHRMLPGFLDWALEKFPVLTRELEPVFKAAEHG